MSDLGWDTVSASSVGLVNQALASSQEGLIRDFAHDGPQGHIEGRFGCWQIVPGAAGRQLQLQVAIREGEATGLPGREAPLNLAGMRLWLLIGLRLDQTGRTREAALVFDTAVMQPMRLQSRQSLEPGEERALLQLFAACLAARHDALDYVIARVPPPSGGDFACLDWAALKAPGGQHFLAVMASQNGRPHARPPAPCISRGSAYCAASLPAVTLGLLLPAVQAQLAPGARLLAEDGAVRLQEPLALAPMPLPGAGPVQPWLQALEVSLAPGGLDIALRCTAVTGRTMAMAECRTALRLSALKGAGPQLLPAGTPVWEAAAEGTAPPLSPQQMAALTTRLEEGFSRRIAGFAAALSGALFADTALSQVSWSGLRPFRPSQAELNGCLMLTDLRVV